MHQEGVHEIQCSQVDPPFPKEGALDSGEEKPLSCFDHLSWGKAYCMGSAEHLLFHEQNSV